MTGKRFYKLASSIDYYQIWDKQEDKGYTIEDAVACLNEQQSKIQQQERKIRKCEAEVGRQLKQIIELQDELQEVKVEYK